MFTIGLLGKSCEIVNLSNCEGSGTPFFYIELEFNEEVRLALTSAHETAGHNITDELGRSYEVPITWSTNYIAPWLREEFSKFIQVLSGGVVVPPDLIHTGYTDAGSENWRGYLRPSNPFRAAEEFFPYKLGLRIHDPRIEAQAYNIHLVAALTNGFRNNGLEVEDRLHYATDTGSPKEWGSEFPYHPPFMER